MCKKFMLLFFISLISISNAQPIINSPELNPIIAEEAFTDYFANYTNQGASGENIIWDFQNITESTGLTFYIFEDPSPLFPQTNITFSFGYNEEYIEMVNNGWYLNGQLNNGEVLVNYSNTLKTLAYPLEYNTNYQDDFYASGINSVGQPFYSFGSLMSEVDAWGKLITPQATFENVLRVHYIINYKDSSNSTSTNMLTDRYVWYQANTHHELFSVNKKYINGNLQTSYIKYLATSSLNIKKNENEITSVYPNPANEKLIVDLNNDMSNIELALFDLHGRKIETPIEYEGNKIILLTANLHSGVYLLQTYNAFGNPATKKIIIKHF